MTYSIDVARPRRNITQIDRLGIENSNIVLHTTRNSGSKNFHEKHWCNFYTGSIEYLKYYTPNINHWLPFYEKIIKNDQSEAML